MLFWKRKFIAQINEIVSIIRYLLKEASILSFKIKEDFVIPTKPGNSVSRGWPSSTGGIPHGVTWHWTATWDLKTTDFLLGGDKAKFKGLASAHYGIGKSFNEGVSRYVTLENRSWHAGKNQTLRYDGMPRINQRDKASRTTIGVEIVNIGYERSGVISKDDWIECYSPNGKQKMLVEPWNEEQIITIIEIGKEIIQRWSHIEPRDHHGHHDICPGYKVDVSGFPFAYILRKIYNDNSLPDVWSMYWKIEERQQVLIELGYDLEPKGADGDWGRISDSALRQFQKDNDLVENGMWTTFVCWKIYELIGNSFH